MSEFFSTVLGVVLAASVAAVAEPSRARDLRLESAKNVGLAALEEGNLSEARRRFETVREIAPEEPLGWANGAVAALRLPDGADAKRLLEEALRRAPNDSRVLALEGVRREVAGDPGGAVESYEKAVAANSRDLVSRWSAAKLLAKLPGGAARAEKAMRAALEQAPANLFLQARLFEIERELGDREGTAAVLAGFARALEPESRSDAKLGRALAESKAALESGDARAAALKFRILENVLRGKPRYQQARRDAEPGVVGLPLEEWSPGLAARLRPRPGSVPVRFAEKRFSSLSTLKGLSAVRVAGREGRDLVFAGDSGIIVARAEEGYRAGPPLPGSGARDLQVADVTNSGALDFVTPGALWVAGNGGPRKTALPTGDRVLPGDFDSDGDLDIFLSSQDGDLLLRNNLDGTWTDVTSSSGLPAGLRSRSSASEDFDRDGDPDIALASAGGLVLLDNLRGGRWALKDAGLPREGSVESVAAGDLNADGKPDLVWSSQTVAHVARNRGDGTFLPAVELTRGGTPLLLDYDNDGFLDLATLTGKGSALFRNDGAATFSLVESPLPPAFAGEAVDFDADGDLDVALITAGGAVGLFENQGGNANGWIDVALEGLPTGSAKVNRLGFGSQVEVKAGGLYVFRTATRPVTRLGLGPVRKADVLRVIWSNGIPQNRLDPPVKTLIREVQQLKGSCPFLYAFDGTRWTFVTDVLGRSPLGLLYDGVHQAPADTREWLLVPGEKLRATDGRLHLDFTEELWETMYLDLAQLFAVDHPAGVELVPNEKMVPPPFPPKALFTVSDPRTPKATDERGRNRTGEIAREDGRHLGGFTPTRYQGIVAPHELVLELPEAREAKKVMLFLTGWIFYSDTSIQVSLSQGSGLRPFGPVLEVPDRRGVWTPAIPAMGFPAGKTKTMPIDLSEVLNRQDPRVRIRTNLEIYWDRIAYTVDDPPASVRRTPLPLSSANLFFRGFSSTTRETADGPHVFVHDEVDVAPRWPDMDGFYTRFGDVRELLSEVDDRYVVMKGGDAVRLEFDATRLPPLPPGWKRDYLFVSDGWDKDADKNTVAGQTVEPLPFHGQDDARYGQAQVPPDPEARRRFVQEYLTRRGGPEEFREAIRSRRP